MYPPLFSMLAFIEEILIRFIKERACFNEYLTLIGIRFWAR